MKIVTNRSRGWTRTAVDAPIAAEENIDRPLSVCIRAALAGDLMRRYLLHRGFEVVYVYNFTDVDDKIIERANEEGVPYPVVSERNIEAFLRAAALHNLMPATHYPRATAHIGEILA